MSNGARLLTALGLVVLTTGLATLSAVGGVPGAIIIVLVVLCFILLGLAFWLFFTALGSDALGGEDEEDDDFYGPSTEGPSSPLT